VQDVDSFRLAHLTNSEEGRQLFIEEIMHRESEIVIAWNFDFTLNSLDKASKLLDDFTKRLANIKEDSMRRVRTFITGPIFGFSSFYHYSDLKLVLLAILVVESFQQGEEEDMSRVIDWQVSLKVDLERLHEMITKVKESIENWKTTTLVHLNSLRPKKADHPHPAERSPFSPPSLMSYAAPTLSGNTTIASLYHAEDYLNCGPSSSSQLSQSTRPSPANQLKLMSQRLDYNATEPEARPQEQEKGVVDLEASLSSSSPIREQRALRNPIDELDDEDMKPSDIISNIQSRIDARKRSRGQNDEDDDDDDDDGKEEIRRPQHQPHQQRYDERYQPRDRRDLHRHQPPPPHGYPAQRSQQQPYDRYQHSQQRSDEPQRVYQDRGREHSRERERDRDRDYEVSKRRRLPDEQYQQQRQQQRAYDDYEGRGGQPTIRYAMRQVYPYPHHGHAQHIPPPPQLILQDPVLQHDRRVPPPRVIAYIAPSHQHRTALVMQPRQHQQQHRHQGGAGGERERHQHSHAQIYRQHSSTDMEEGEVDS
jgi:hypothetical protein